MNQHHDHTHHGSTQAAPSEHAMHQQHDKHAGHHEGMFRRPFWVALLLTIPILVYSHLFQQLLDYTAPAFPGSTLLSPILGSIVYWYSGWLFLKGAWSEIRAHAPGMMTLVSLAISTAYLYSLAITFGFIGGMDFYWELATLVTIMLLGHWMEMRAIGAAQNALNELAKLLPDTAERVKADGTTETIPAAQLQPGDLILVRPGASIPADGLIQSGQSQVNESMITGESRPVSKHPDDLVIAGTVNGSGALRIEIQHTGEQTTLAGIMRLVAEAQSSRSQAQDLADRAASWLTYIALAVAMLTAIGWGFARGFDSYTLERIVTVLVVACPHALGLAIPLVIAISTTLSARNGILVRDRMALEQARLINTVIFDKTGTLTQGEQGLVDFAITEGIDETTALALVTAIEADSEHPIAAAFMRAATERTLTWNPATDFQALPGRGVQASVDGRILQVGGPRLLEQEAVELPESIATKTRQWGERGQGVVYLLEQGHVLAAFALADVIRPESRTAVAELQAQGIEVAMLTGDSADVARWVAEELNIQTYFAQVLPEHKAAKVQELQRNGNKVAMVGDGVNDAPALAQADVGIAIGAGTDVAQAAAGIVLVRNDPRDVARIRTLSRATYNKMIQNLAWAVGYNVVALPLAAGVFAGVGLVLPAWVGAVLMSLSTIIVAINSQTLRRLKLR